ncbi:MAG: DNA primase [Candidatus Cloacimonetes bacterium]|nr:DNA primase [Candidatus Cloacimonadota bacterium]MBS3767749.1 DNA primase [Candidatus Cloacimonadota bacterium]
MRYNQQTIDKVREANNIVDVINSYVPLKKSGANFKTRCPFHDEKTPSFIVSPSKQIYKCFGCGKGGNVFTFLMEYEKITFPEAVQKLAQRAHIKLPEKEGSSQKQSLYNEMYKIYELAHKYYSKNLQKKGKEAKNFLKNRGVESDTIKKFQLGLAPDKWDGLVSFLKGKGLSKKAVMKSGLFSQKNQRIYDKFRKRIIFPIFSTDGKILAFGGRIYKEDDDSSVKYLNSPEQIIYQKRYQLYGLNVTKRKIIDAKKALVVEGYMDLCKLYQFGFSNIVASLGTALTTQQIKLLARYTKNIIILYDGDEAGYAATARAIKTCLQNDIFPSVVMMPRGYDPDSYLDEFGKDDLAQLIDNPLSFYQFLGKYLQADLDLEHKRKALDAIIDDLGLISDPTQKELFVNKVAEEFKIDNVNIIKSLNQRKKKKWKKYSESKIDRKQYIEEREFIGMILNKPELVEPHLESIDDSFFTHPFYRKFFNMIKLQKTPADFLANKASLLDKLEPEERDMISDIIFSQSDASEKKLNKLLAALRIRRLENELLKINKKIQNNPDDYKNIKRKRDVLKKLHQLKAMAKGGSVRKILR